VSSGPESKQDYETPWDFIRAVEKRWGDLTLDLAATHESAKAPEYFGPGQDSLTTPWPTEGIALRLWLNPPFAKIGPWAAKCHAWLLGFAGTWGNQRAAFFPHRLFLLVPASIGSAWFERYVWQTAMVYALAGPRLSFDGVGPFPKDLMLCVYGERPGFDVWRWGA
jgi:DNA N-6-adenine-methyltransferase (Dam)